LSNQKLEASAYTGVSADRPAYTEVSADKPAYANRLHYGGEKASAGEEGSKLTPAYAETSSGQAKPKAGC